MDENSIIHSKKDTFILEIVISSKGFVAILVISFSEE